MKEDIVIEVRNLKKSFKEQTILDGVNVSFQRGKISAMLGKSGTGKSVLMKHIIGIFEPDEGEILFDGRDIVPLSYDEKREVRRRLGYLFQDAALFDSMTVEENIAFPLVEVLNIRDKQEIRRRVKKMLDWVQLSGIEEKMPDELSGGMRKRIGLARTLASEPEVMLFDEPTTGLDPILGESVHQLIQRVNQELDITCIIITHDIVGSFELADTIAFLHEGKVLTQGTPQEVQHFQHEVLQKFLDYSFVCEDEALMNGEATV